MIVPLFVGREKSIAALESAMKDEKEIFMVAQKSAQKDDPAKTTFIELERSESSYNFCAFPMVRSRFWLRGKNAESSVNTSPARTISWFVPKNSMEIDEAQDRVKLEALMRSIRESFETYAKMTKKVHLEIVGTIASIEDPSKLADVVIAQINTKLEDKQRILEICDVPERMETIYETDAFRNRDPAC